MMKCALFRWLVLTFGFVIQQGLYGQINLKLTGQNAESDLFIRQLELRKNYSSAQQAISALKLMQMRAYEQGYLAASIDSIQADTLTVRASFYLGKVLQVNQFNMGNIPAEWLAEIGLQPETWQGKPLTQKTVKRFAAAVLEYAENSGLPFAQLQLIPEKAENQQLNATWELRKGPFFSFDTLSIIGDAKLSKRFLYSYLNIKPGEAYNEQKVRQIDQKLDKLNFIKRASSSRIYFINDGVRMLLYLDARKSDRIDGIVGFAPNSGDNAADLLVTGEAEIDLNNLFKRNMEFDMHWQSFLQNSQQLQVSTAIPYLFNTQLGITGSFEFIKADTSFFTLDNRVGIRYLFQGNDYLEAYYQVQSASLGGIDTADIRRNKALPNRNPIRTNNYGLKLVRQKLDYMLNPRKGYTIETSFSIGTREIQKNPRVASVEFSNQQGGTYNLYDSLDLKSTQGQFATELVTYIPIGSKSTLVPKLYGEYLLANSYFINDLYRFGGTNSLKGFDEESLLASGYGVFSLEYRYLFSRNAFFQLFGNVAYTKDRSQETVALDIPYGFGLGVNLETKSGLLNLAYALGSQQGNPIQFSQAKIHFGVVNYF